MLGRWDFECYRDLSPTTFGEGVTNVSGFLVLKRPSLFREVEPEKCTNLADRLVGKPASHGARPPTGFLLPLIAATIFLSLRDACRPAIRSEANSCTSALSSRFVCRGVVLKLGQGLVMRHEGGRMSVMGMGMLRQLRCGD